MDTGVLFSVFSKLMKCPRCGYFVEMNHCLEFKQGLAQKFEIVCRSTSCKWKEIFFSSREAPRKSTRGNARYEVNLRTIVSFREFGQGHAAIQLFCGYMNMPFSMSETTYNDTVKDALLPIYKQVVENDINEATCELREFGDQETIGNDGINDITASFDGSWQRRGYASLNGVVTGISIDTGKCLAYEILTKTCKACEMWDKKKGTDKYEQFMLDHTCSINHKGSAGAMEASGVRKMFEKSVKDLNIRYMTYIGDGDSKAFPAVVEAQPYGPDKIPVKGECVGHVQKRVGTRLRKLKKTCGSEILADGKKLGGIGRLTDQWVNTLQTYYGMAIRQNTDNLSNMRKAVGAVLYHCSEATDAQARHQFCDKDSEWCRMRVAERKNQPFTEKPGLPVAVRDKIMPIFQSLSKTELLEKCLHGKTQNNNEGINQFIWKRIPKAVFVGRNVLEMGVCSAILNFNSGSSTMIEIITLLGLNPGYFTNVFCEKKDEIRISKMKRKMSDEGLRDRKRKRAIKKGYIDKDKANEGKVYSCGSF